MITFIDMYLPTLTGVGGFFAKIIMWLATITASIALGIILFTLLLKIITLPFDYISRSQMRKNSVRMEKMRPDLEKLQKQYAGDKALYNQKMMALYKKNGYSMWGACLPTILTLVIFILAMTGFTSFSQYANKQIFYDMSINYNNVFYSGMEIDGEYIIKNNDDYSIKIDYDKLIGDMPTPSTKTVSENSKHEKLKNQKGQEFSITVTTSIEGTTNYVEIKTTNSYIYSKASFSEEGESRKFAGIQFYVIEDKIMDNTLASAENNNLTFVSTDGQKYNYKQYKDAFKPQSGEEGISFLKDIGRIKSAETYRQSDTKFLWIKNIWIADSPFSNPVRSSLTNTSSGCTASCNPKSQGFLNLVGASNTSDIFKSTTADHNVLYSELIARLDTETNQVNGYLILAVLTAVVSLLTQLVMNKSQKAQMELQSVDGRGAQTQKMMMWLMPIMMLFFSIINSAAFSIYMILSSLITMLTTFLINFIVDKKLQKEDMKESAKKNIIRGRVHDEKPAPTEKKPNKKKKDEVETVDFLKSAAENKRIRGRLKK